MERRNLSDPDSETGAGRVLAKLRRMIVSGRLAPGSRMVESELAEHLGVSRTPIRTALNYLNHEGLVVRFNVSGERTRPVVAPLTSNDARELFEIAGSVQGLAAYWAASLSDADRRSTVEELRGLETEMYETVLEEDGSRSHYFGIDASFHKIVVTAGNWPRLLDLYQSHRRQIERYVRHYMTKKHFSLTRSLKEHQQIISSIQKGQPEEADQVMRLHWKRAEKTLLDDIAAAGERGMLKRRNQKVDHR